MFYVDSLVGQWTGKRLLMEHAISNDWANALIRTIPVANGLSILLRGETDYSQLNQRVFTTHQLHQLFQVTVELSDIADGWG